MDQRFYTAQYGQDRIIEKLCYPAGTETHRGTFLEVGAWDGICLSNTYFLEKVRDWSGLLVEPLPDKAEQARHNRWCPVWQGCVAGYDGTANFRCINGYSGMLSGVIKDFHPNHLRRANDEIRDRKQETQDVILPCKTLNTLLAEAGLTKGIDLLSLDTQSTELSVLKAYDPKRHPIKAILLDSNGYNKNELELWFRLNGYQQHWKHQHADEILWIDPTLPWSWERASTVT